MKPLHLLAILLGTGTAFAGPMTTTTKEYKHVEEEKLCFEAGEFQIDVFGQYSVGEGPHQAGIFRDHGWGGGLGFNYFFTRQLGFGVDASWLYAKEADYVLDTRDEDDDDDGHTTLHNFSGSIIVRFPIDPSCLAPYVYVGGGGTVDGEQWASAHGGIGVEYRFDEGKGVFFDTRWTYLGDRFGHDDLNYFSTRIGVRFAF